LALNVAALNFDFCFDIALSRRIDVLCSMALVDEASILWF
jgi:hypothetical protein